MRCKPHISHRTERCMEEPLFCLRDRGLEVGLVQEILAKLTAKDDKYACAIAEKIISESQDTDEWYEYFDDFASLLDHPKSLVRNRALYILAANAQWDDEN